MTSLEKGSQHKIELSFDELSFKNVIKFKIPSDNYIEAIECIP